MVLPTEPESGSQTTTPPDKQTSQSVAEAVSDKALVTPDNPVAPEASPAPTGVEASGAPGASDKSESISDVNASCANGQASATISNLPTCIPDGLHIFMGGDGNAYMGIEDENNAYALPIGGKAANRVLQGFAHQSGTRFKSNEIKEINEELTASAEHSGNSRDVFYRCAPFQNGVEIDIGNDRHTRIRITPGKVATIDKGSKTTEPFNCKRLVNISYSCTRLHAAIPVKP